MTEQPNPIHFTTTTIPEAVTTRLAVLGAVAEYTQAKTSGPGLGGGTRSACDVIDMLTLADWVLQQGADADQPDEPVAESPTTDEVNAMLREAAAEQRDAKGHRPLQEDDVVTINDDAVNGLGGVVGSVAGQWVITRPDGPGAPLTDEDGDLRLLHQESSRYLYVLPKHVTLVTPNVTPEPGPEAARPFMRGDLVDVAEGATYPSVPGDRDYPTGSAGRKGLVVCKGKHQGAVTVGEDVEDNRWSVAPQFLTLVTPAEHAEALDEF